MKSAGHHPTTACRKPRHWPPTCYNCGGNHVTSYKGCPEYQKIKRRLNSSHEQTFPNGHPSQPKGKPRHSKQPPYHQHHHYPHHHRRRQGYQPFSDHSPPHPHQQNRFAIIQDPETATQQPPRKSNRICSPSNTKSKPTKNPTHEERRSKGSPVSQDRPSHKPSALHWTKDSRRQSTHNRRHTQLDFTPSHPHPPSLTRAPSHAQPYNSKYPRNLRKNPAKSHLARFQEKLKEDQKSNEWSGRQLHKHKESPNFKEQERPHVVRWQKLLEEM